MAALSDYLTPSVVVSFLLGILAKVVGDFVSDRMRTRSARRMEHFRDMVAQAIQPFIDELRGYYIPILKYEFLNVGVGTKEVAKGKASVTATPEWRDVLVPVRPGDQHDHGLFRIHKAETGESTDDRMYAVALRGHFTSAANAVDRFRKGYSAFESQVLSTVGEFKQTLDKALNHLPSSREVASFSQPFANTNYLAVYVYARAAGLGGLPPIRAEGKNGQTLLTCASTMLAQGPPAQMDALLGLIDSLVDDKGRFSMILQRAASLRDEAERLLSDLEEIRLVRRLPGRCKYC